MALKRNYELIQFGVGDGTLMALKRNYKRNYKLNSLVDFLQELLRGGLQFTTIISLECFQGGTGEGFGLV
jgi:hypothetical protein